MKKQTRLLLTKAVNSLTLSVEHFNRPYDRGRVEAVLILLDHSFEMLLKAAILHKGGRIREKRAKNTIGFDACVRRSLSDVSLAIINQEQALTLQAINGLRDAAQHHLLDISEQLLYINAQSGLTLFRDIYENTFGTKLSVQLPERVLPLSTKPPTDIDTLFADEVATIKSLLAPGTRRQIDAISKLRALSILDNSLQGQNTQPSDGDLAKIANRIANGKSWTEVFPGVAAIQLTTKGHGPALDLRITKRDDATPVTIVPEGTEGAAVVAVRRVDDLGFYNLGRDQLAENLKITGSKTSALIWKLKIQDDAECYKSFKIGSVPFKRYSHKTLATLKEALKTADIEAIWSEYSAQLKKKPKKAKGA